MGKRILQVFLVLFFIILVVCGIVIGSYAFSSPNTELKSDSRLLISGAWVDLEQKIRLELDENGNFKYCTMKDDGTYEANEVIAEGFYKINESSKQIKLFIFPWNRQDGFKDYMNLFFFAQMTYTGLKDNDIDYKKPYEIKDAPKCSFLVKFGGKKEGTVLTAVMPAKTLDLYSHGKHFEAKNK